MRSVRRSGRPRGRLLGYGLASSQMFWMALTARSTVAVALLPVLTASRAGRDGWLAFLLGLPPGLALSWLMTCLPGRSPGLGLADQARRALGRVAGSAVAALFALTYVHLTGLLVRDYAEVVVTAVLPSTSLSAVVGIVAILAAVMAAQETPVVGRMASLAGPVVVGAVLSIAVLVSPEIELARLQPFLETGWRGLLSGGLESVVWHSMAFFYPAVAPAILDAPRGRRAFLWGMAGATLLGAFVSALTVTVVPAELAAQAGFPLFLVARLVSVGEFIQRIEALAIGAWGLGLLIGASLFLHSAALSLANLVGLDEHRRLIKPTALLSAVLSMAIAGDTAELREFTDVRVLTPYTAAMIWLPAAAWAVAAFARDRAGPAAAGEGGR